MAQKTLQSTVAFQNSSGIVLASGTIVMRLSQDAMITSGGGQVAPTTRTVIQLDVNGLVPAGTLIWANDQLTPTTTFYISRVYDSNGNLVYGPENWVLAGTSPIDVSQLVPASL